MFDQVVEWVSGSDWSYGVVFLIAMLDAFFPLVPSETVAITAGVLAGAGDLSLPLAIAAATTGAFVGDNISYGIGTWVGEHTIRRWFRGEKAHKRLDWAEHQLAERGGYLIVVARFIPGGRTAVTFTSGYVHTMSWRRFVVYDAIAALVWGNYTVLLGYFGGSQFEDEPWKGLLLAFALAVGITTAIELFRHRRAKRRLA